MNTSRLQRRHGFSFIELLVVIVIMGILAAIAIPMYLGQRTRAKNAEVQEGARTVAIAVMSFVASTDDNPPLPVADCTRDFLVAHGAISAGDWPDNAFFAGEPMKQDSREGDFTYELVGGPSPFVLTAHLRDSPDFVLP